jgi:hypothetical protein
MNLSRSVTLALLAVVSIPAIVQGGAGNRAGTNGASELLIPVGARDIAMGGSTASISTGVEALFWNPAAVAKMRNSTSVYVSHMSYLADIGVNYVAVATSVEGFGVLALNLKSLSIGEIPVTTTQNPDGTGQTFTPQFFTLGLSYARQLSDRVSVGITTNLISERMAEVSASGISFNAGVVYDNLAAIEGLSLGVTVKNIGPQMKFDGTGLLVQGAVANQSRPDQFYQVQAASFELPSSIEFGLGYRRNLDGLNAVIVSTSFQSNNFADDEYKVGAEYSYQDMFFLRGGYNFAQRQSEEREFLFGPSFGAGVHYALGSLDVTVDYAFRKMQIFDNNHIISVKLGF